MVKQNAQSGQILIVVLLVLVIVLTVGLSVATRTVSNIRISRENEEAQRAFQAAEAGIEAQRKSIKFGINNAVSINEANLSNNARFDTQITQVQAAVNERHLLLDGNQVEQNVGIDIWLADYPPANSTRFNGNVSIYYNPQEAAVPNENFEQEDCNNPSGDRKKMEPAIEVILLRGDVANPTVVKKIFDRCGSRIDGDIGRNPGNGSQGGLDNANPSDRFGTVEQVRFRRAARLDIGNGTQIRDGIVMKIVPLFNSGVMGFTYNCTGWAGVCRPAITFGSRITSTGIAGDAQRKLVYFESNPQVPVELFQYAVISQDQ